MEIIQHGTFGQLTGKLERTTGWFIRTRDGKFYAAPTGRAPREGHWRFICLCARMAREGLFITDIRVSSEEFNGAYLRAGGRQPLVHDKRILNASEVRFLKSISQLHYED